MQKAIEESGIEAAIKKYHTMKAEQKAEYYFGENYMPMGTGKVFEIPDERVGKYMICPLLSLQ